MTPLEVLGLALKLAILMVEGQPIEVRKKMWEMHIKDVEALRKFLKIDA